MLIYHHLGKNNRSVGGRSSETLSRPIGKNKNVIFLWVATPCGHVGSDNDREMSPFSEMTTGLMETACFFETFLLAYKST
jgi:hypothetical protein